MELYGRITIKEEVSWYQHTYLHRVGQHCAEGYFSRENTEIVELLKLVRFDYVNFYQFKIVHATQTPWIKSTFGQ